MTRYPLQFAVRAAATAGIQSPWEAEAASDKSLACAIPPEFEGPGNGFSPEDFFALAVANCFIATFKVVAERSKLAFTRIEAAAILTVNRDPQGLPWMEKIGLHITLKLHDTQESDRALRLLDKTSKVCLVARSIKSETSFKFDVAVG